MAYVGVSVTYREAMAQAAKQYLQECLAKTNGNVTYAARIAGVHRVSFYDLCNRHQVVYEKKVWSKQAYGVFPNLPPAVQGEPR